MSKLYLLLDGIQMLRSSKSFSAADYNALVGWFQDYMLWLQQSPRGAIQSQAQNYQGTWYDCQLTSLLLFLGTCIYIFKSDNLTII